MSSDSIAASPGNRALLLVFYACLIAIVVNAALFTWWHSNPLISSDAWYFVDAFVRKVVGGDLSALDFFVKRGDDDHAQPLSKLLLYLNVRIVGLDFTYEGIAGLVFATGTLAMIVWMVRRELPQQYHRPAVLLCLVAIAALFLSLNSSGLYTWPLVTMGYALHFYALLLVWVCWRSLESGRPWALFAWGLFVGICADDSGFIIVTACVLGLAFIGLRTGRYRDIAKVAGVLVASLVASRLIYAGVGAIAGEAPDAGGPGALAQLGTLAGMLHDAGRWALLPSAASLVHPDQLRIFFPDTWKQWSLALGLLVLAGQAWFWVTVWRTRASGIVFLAVTLMLLGYGYLAGVLLVRVTNFGTEYLVQARYVLIYVLVPMAILLLAVERIAASGQPGRPGRIALTIAACAIIVLQIPLSRGTWTNAVYVDRYYQAMAGQMFEMARNPQAVPAQCLPLLTVCKWPAAQRAEVFQLLQEHRLNLFSQQFDDAHRMHEGETP
jgi:hypothetical protein